MHPEPPTGYRPIPELPNYFMSPPPESGVLRYYPKTEGWKPVTVSFNPTPIIPLVSPDGQPTSRTLRSLHQSTYPELPPLPRGFKPEPVWNQPRVDRRPQAPFRPVPGFEDHYMAPPPESTVVRYIPDRYGLRTLKPDRHKVVYLRTPRDPDRPISARTVAALHKLTFPDLPPLPRKPYTRSVQPGDATVFRLAELPPTNPDPYPQRANLDLSPVGRHGFRFVPGHPNYLVDRNGNVCRHRFPEPCLARMDRRWARASSRQTPKPASATDPRLVVRLPHATLGRPVRVLAADLVGAAFADEPTTDPQP